MPAVPVELSPTAPRALPLRLRWSEARAEASETPAEKEAVCITRKEEGKERGVAKAEEGEGIDAFDAVDELIKLGYEIDLSDFSIVKDPDEITVVTDILRNFPENSKTYIMTARRGNSIGPIIDYLDEIGIDAGQVRVIATQGESKGDVMATMLAQKIIKATGKSNINRIEYYEDSQKNIEDVLAKICDNEKINSIKPDNFELDINNVIGIDGGYKLQKISC